MAETLIKAYVCSELRGSIKYEAPSDPAGSPINQGTKTIVYLEPWIKTPGCSGIGAPRDERTGKFTAPLLPDPEPASCSGNCDYYENPPDDPIVAEWETLPGQSAVAAPFPTIRFQLPDFCGWIYTEVYAVGPPQDGAGGIIIAYVTPADSGAIPEPLASYDRKEAFMGGIEDKIQIIENLPVPGQQIQLRHYFKTSTGIKAQQAGLTNWCAAAFFGGVVSEVIGDYGSIDIKYKVKAFTGNGIEEVDAIPTDFVEWEVDDWVFLITGSDAGGDVHNSEQDSLIANCSGLSLGLYYILPMKVGNYGA